MTSEGLIAPEGVYKMTASYVLPPQPSFMSASYAPNTFGMVAIPASGSSTNQNNPNTGNFSALTPVSSQPAGQSSNLVSNSQSGSNANANNQSNIGQSNPNGSISSGGLNGTMAANSSSIGSTEQYYSSTSLAGPSNESSFPKTALHHISIQAPSAWSHIPVLPPSRISVASVRHPHTQTSQSIPSLSRKDRVQHSQASTIQQNSLNAPNVEGSFEGSNDSFSDLGKENSGTDLKSENQMRNWGPVLEATLASQGIDGVATHVTGGAGGLPGMSALQLLSHLGTTGSSEGQEGAPFFMSGGNGNSAGLVGGSNNSNKNLLKPKNNIKQTSSSFVQRLQAHPDFAKLIASRTEGMQIDRHAFISRGRMFFWLGETGNGWIKEPLGRLTFATLITSHDVNQQTRSPARLDVIIAFNSSDLVWLEAISMRYSRINKAGCINDAPITSVRWIPGSETLFLTTHNDGTCTIFDIARDDSSPGSWTPVNAVSLDLNNVQDGDDEEEEILMAQKVGENDEPSEIQPVRIWDPRSGILVTRPAHSENESTKKVWSKLNPVAHWRVARNVSITDMAFSPDHTKLALVSTDGTLKLLNLLTESLIGTFHSYYGAMNRVIWSPDAKFLLTAGCDDLISIWTNDGRLLSRCPGHSSFVTGVAFDPWKWKVEDRTYRFVSVGEDGKVFLWDFSSAALHRPRLPHSANSAKRNIGSTQGQQSTPSLLHDQYVVGKGNSASGARRSSTALEDHHRNANIGQPAFKGAQSRAEVAELQPVASFQVGGNVSSTNISDGTNLVAFASTSLQAQNSSNVNGSTSGTEASPGQSGGVSANTTTPTPTTLPPATNSINEPGSASDLLIDVRCRPDGIVLMHKSGTLRYLQRPFNQNTGSIAQKLAIRSN